MADQLAAWGRAAISYTGKAYSTDLFLSQLGAALPLAA
jgi:hypothetical protein